MHTIKCPQCGSDVRWFPPRSFSQWRTGKQQCSECGAWLECSNSTLVGGLSGLLFGGIIVGSRYCGFPNEWLRFAVVIAICWILGPFIVKTLGRWQVLPSGLKDSTKVQIWSRVLSISWWLAAIAITVTVINMGLLTRRLITILESTSYDPEIGEQAVQQWWFSVKLNAVVGYGVCSIALIGCIVASFMRRRARVLDQLAISSD